jgi:hypothetical protein
LDSILSPRVGDRDFFNSLLALFVQPRVQEFAGPEVGDDLGRDFDCGAGAGILAEARAAVLDEEGAKASDLDSISPGKCVADGREDGFDNALNVPTLEMRVQLCHPSHQFRLRHDSPPP